jgi:hypothetical protein
MPRRILLVGVTGGAVLLLALVIFALFVRFPMVLTTGDARLQRWLGPDGARWGYVALTLAIGAGAVAVAVRGTRDLPTRAAWLPGAALGSALGLLVLALSLAQAAIATTEGGLQAAPLLLMAALVLGPPLIGGIVASSAGRASAGAVAGFWHALTLGLVAAVGVIAADALFADRLLRTAWVGYASGDRLCAGVHGATLLGCAVGDDLGFAASVVVFGPVLGLGLGALGGLVGRALARDKRPGTAPLAAALKPALIFAALLAVVMVAELAGNLW